MAGLLAQALLAKPRTPQSRLRDSDANIACEKLAHARHYAMLALFAVVLTWPRECRSSFPGPDVDIVTGNVRRSVRQHACIHTEEELGAACYELIFHALLVSIEELLCMTRWLQDAWQPLCNQHVATVRSRALAFQASSKSTRSG
jgi:hypothetical protein